MKSISLYLQKILIWARDPLSMIFPQTIVNAIISPPILDNQTMEYVNCVIFKPISLYFSGPRPNPLSGLHSDYYDASSFSHDHGFGFDRGRGMDF